MNHCSAKVLTTLLLTGVGVGISACQSGGRSAGLVRQNQALREDIRRVEQEKEKLSAELATSQQQLGQLTHMDQRRPSDLFAPVSIEIASLSGGANFDDRPGDDGVTVHLKPLDADGQVVKVPGAIAIQLLDNSNLTSPKVVGLCEVREPQDLRKAWMGILGTNHYTIKCPFNEGATLPAAQKISVNVTFTDFLTGKVLTVGKEVAFSPSSSSPP